MNAPMTIMDQMSMLLNYYSPFIVLNDNVCIFVQFWGRGHTHNVFWCQTWNKDSCFVHIISYKPCCFIKLGVVCGR